MKGQTIQRFIGSMRRTIAAHEHDDAVLLDRYRTQRDLSALDAIVRKHGGMVLNACRRVLQTDADIEDAFQATFLVLMNDPGRVRRAGSLGSWLYGVGHRIALQILAGKRRRQRLTHQAATRRPSTPDLTVQEACLILHEELDRLPTKYRHVLMLCYLEGKSRDEAADALGWSLNEVRGALERGRERLRVRLEKRGVTLTVGLLGMVGHSVTAGVPSAHLIQRALSPATSPTVTELARGVFPMLHDVSLKLGTALVVLAGVIALGIQWEGVQAGPVPKDAPNEGPAPRGKPKDSAPPADTSETVEFRGTVVAADGKPVANAHVYLLYYTAHRENMPSRTTTDADGKYTFTVKKSAFHRDYQHEPWRGATTCVVAEGHGLSWSDENPARIRMEPTGELTGRFVNLEGKPLAGVRVEVHGLQQPPNRDLTRWLTELTETNVGLPTERKHLQGFAGAWMGVDLGRLIPVAVSGADGRFRLPNIGKERVLDIVVSGPTVETRTFKMSTREQTTIIADEWERTDRSMPGRKIHYVGNNFDMVLNHGRTVSGVVKDAQTGQPIAGASVYEYHLANDPERHAPMPRRPQRTDAAGKYTLMGLPVKGRNVLVVSGPAGQPYLQQQKTMPQPEGFGPATLDFELTRGTVVTVRPLDKTTRQPVRGMPSYFTLANNEAVRTIKGYAHPQAEFFGQHPTDGSFTMVVAPGPGLIAFRSAGANNYMMGVGAEDFTDAQTGDSHHIDTRPYYVLPSNYNNLVRIAPKVGQASLEVTVELDAGQTRIGRLVPPARTKLTGTFEVQNQRPSVMLEGELTKVTTTDFTIEGLREGQTRLLVVRVPDQQLTGWAIVTLKQAKLVEIPLVPWASVRGRALDADGKPFAQARIVFMQAPEDGVNRSGLLPQDVQTDAQGAFDVTGLTPGLKYRVGILRGGRVVLAILEGAVFKPGETRDLGEVRAKME